MRKIDEGAYKKIQEYSYSLSNGIGKGYSSQVYKGKNDSTDEIVAVKVIDLRMLKGQVHKNLLASQIEVLKSLRNCPNIIQLYDVYNTKNNTYIITQLCDGGDLGKALSNRKIIPEPQAIDYVKQIINGYSYLYKQGIIHRDLKPANVFLKDGKIKIADFGFAMKSAEGKKYCSYNVGSPIYMPPQALNENKYSFKSDIWAIGVIFYEMLTGRTPWKAKTQKELGRMLISIPIKKLLPKNISQATTNFLLRTLQIDQNMRMCPDELTRFIFQEEHGNRSTSIGFTQRRSGSQQKAQKLPEYSLTRNSINTPKNPRFTIMKSAQENKNSSLPKTAATISGKTENNFGIIASNHIYGTQHNPGAQSQQPSQNKIISKQLLSQIHFCRFLFKLLQRIKQKINNEVSLSLRNSMAALIFQRLDLVKSLELIADKNAKDYKNTQDYEKILQIITQYEDKYSRDLSFYDIAAGHTAIKDIKQQLQSQICAIYGIIKQNQSQVDLIKEEVIVLDYLVTLKQLLNLLQNNNIQQFHSKSKMEAIVQGAPARNITQEHVRAITSKLRAIKLL